MPQPWWYLSFADGTRPAGRQFLGAVIVHGVDIRSAIVEAHRRGINPGGEVCGKAWPAGFTEPPERFRNRLLTRSDIADLDVALEGN